MKAKLCILISCLFPYSAFACPDILGQWESSLSLSREFNASRAIIEERTREFRNQIIGKTTTTFSETEMTMDFEETNEMVIDGKEFPWDSDSVVSKYEILGCTENQLVIRSFAFDLTFLSILNFEDANTYWVYEGKPNGTGNDHTREYFVRK